MRWLRNIFHPAVNNLHMWGDWKPIWPFWERVLLGRGVVPISGHKPNTAKRLRKLLLQLYVSAAINPEAASDAELDRVLDIVFAAAEGRPFPDLGLPFPRGNS
jgi:hypothetical protein